jgi:hypothetical protein
MYSAAQTVSSNRKARQQGEAGRQQKGKRKPPTLAATGAIFIGL